MDEEWCDSGVGEVVVFRGELTVGMDKLVVAWADTAVEEAGKREKIGELVGEERSFSRDFLHDVGDFIEEGFAEVGIRFAVPEEVLGGGTLTSAGGASTEVGLDVLGRFLSVLCPDGSSENRLKNSSEFEVGDEVGLDGRSFEGGVEVGKGGLEVEVGCDPY